MIYIGVGAVDKVTRYKIDAVVQQVAAVLVVSRSENITYCNKISENEGTESPSHIKHSRGLAG